MNYLNASIVRDEYMVREKPPQYNSSNCCGSQQTNKQNITNNHVRSVVFKRSFVQMFFQMQQMFQIIKKINNYLETNKKLSGTN
jgi:hypothetical protein